MSIYDSNPKTQTEQDAVPHWMHMPIDRAVYILEDMTGGQLYNFELSNFVFTPEPALKLMLAAETAIKAVNTGVIELSKDALWAIEVITEARRDLEAERPQIPAYIRAALSKHEVGDMMEDGQLLVPADYMVYEPTYRPKTERKRNAGYVYVLRSPTGAYKIGLARNPQNRLETFTVKLPFEVEYDTLIKTDDMRGLEAELHTRYSHKRINGEWFALDADDLAELRAMGGAE